MQPDLRIEVSRLQVFHQQGFVGTMHVVTLTFPRITDPFTL